MSGSAWNSEQYLRFAEERTRPCRDLAARVAVEQVRTVIDLGCGPGNSTEVLAGRWPAAAITGLDNSAEMLRSAHETQPGRNWVEGDIAAWAAAPGERYNVVFSNAALQWVGGHVALFPQLLARVRPPGALAVQVPAYDSPAHNLSRAMADSAAWRPLFAGGIVDWHTHDAAFYFDVLAPHAQRLEIWETEYIHVMDSPADIVEWYKGTGLRPFLGALRNEVDRERFLAEYLSGIERLYPPRANGRVLFPFRRLFAIAYR